MTGSLIGEGPDKRLILLTVYLHQRMHGADQDACSSLGFHAHGLLATVAAQWQDKHLHACRAPMCSCPGGAQKNVSAPCAGYCGAQCRASFLTATGYDYFGDNLPNMPIYPPSASACQQSCYTNAQCTAFTYTPTSGDPAARCCHRLCGTKALPITSSSSKENDSGVYQPKRSAWCATAGCYLKSGYIGYAVADPSWTTGALVTGAECSYKACHMLTPHGMSVNNDHPADCVCTIPLHT